MALALQTAGFQVTLVDPVAEKVRANAKFDGRSYALSIASKRVLSVLGVWDAVANAQPILEIKVTGEVIDVCTARAIERLRSNTRQIGSRLTRPKV